MIDNNYSDLLRAIQMEPELKALLNSMINTAISFKDAWSVVGSCSPILWGCCNCVPQYGNC
jgi:hypothetical protein